MSLDVLLAYPRPAEESPAAYTPLSILFPGAMFEAEGKSVAYWDERFDSQEEFDGLARDAVEVGVSAFTGTQAGRAARLLQRAKLLNPRVVGAVGGHHVRILPEQVLAEPFVDKIYATPPYGEDLFPWGPQYVKHFARTDTQYFTSRGCPYACSFCALRSPWVPRAAQTVERELKTIHDAVGFKEISFSDPNIATGVWRGDDGTMQRMDRVERIKAIGNITRSLGVRWDGNMRSPYLTPAMVDALVESQCYSLEIGCESGDDWFLRHVIRKGHGVDSIRNACRVMKGSGISLIYSFITGMPRETPAQRARTFDLIDEIAAEDPLARISIYQFSPYPGSPMYDEAVAGVEGFPKFDPPTTMEGWGALRLMRTAAYWVTGLTFRRDNLVKNFPTPEEMEKIQPYVDLALRRWKDRDVDNFPVDEVEAIVSQQVSRRHMGMGLRAEGFVA